MKKLMLLVLMLSALAFAQQPSGPAQQAAAQTPPPMIPGNAMLTEQRVPVSLSDLYCAGFIGQPLSKANFVAAGQLSPLQVHYGRLETIYLAGSGYEPGTRVSIVRQLHDPNRFEAFKDQHKTVAKLGEIYAEIGYADIVAIRNGMAVATVELACSDVVVGDQVVPFTIKTPVTYPLRTQMEAFPSEAGKLRGQIVMAREFDLYLGAGAKLYLDIGAKQGVKVGDTFRVVRGYGIDDLDVTDRQAYQATIYDDTQKTPPAFPPKDDGKLPGRALGEVVILTVGQTSSTAMVTFAREEFRVGDHVELEEAMASTQQAPPKTQ